MDLIERSKAIEAYMARRFGGSEEVIAAIRALPTASVSDEMVERARHAWINTASDYPRLDISIRAALVAAMGDG